MPNKAIWFRDYQLGEIQRLCLGTMVAHLGIELTRLGDECLVGTMPVDHRTTQPAGLLHGGASVALAESLGSIAANLCVDPDHWVCVGQEINASHLRPVRKGLVTGTATPLYLGRSSQVWDVTVTDERQRSVCVVRLTVAVVAAGHGGGKIKVFDG
jgi:1,4-dihydroxy-2-naphthoyl-CoA hydrolase